MRFLLECVRCCSSDPPCSGPAPDPPIEAPPSEESRSLFSPTSPPSPSLAAAGGSSRIRKKKRMVSRPAGRGAEWKPSLYAISEDHSVHPANAERNRTVDSRRSGGKRCAVLKAGIRPRGRSDYYGHETLPMMVPAFSPAPFMF